MASFFHNSRSDDAHGEFYCSNKFPGFSAGVVSRDEMERKVRKHYRWNKRWTSANVLLWKCSHFDVLRGCCDGVNFNPHLSLSHEATVHFSWFLPCQERRNKRFVWGTSRCWSKCGISFFFCFFFLISCMECTNQRKYPILTQPGFGRFFQREWNSFLKEVDRKSERTTTEQLGRLEEGDSLPEDLSLRSIETDSDISLKQLLGQKSIVLVLLRHLSWLPWRDHVKLLQTHQVSTGTCQSAKNDSWESLNLFTSSTQLCKLRCRKKEGHPQTHWTFSGHNQRPKQYCDCCVIREQEEVTGMEDNHQLLVRYSTGSRQKGVQGRWFASFDCKGVQFFGLQFGILIDDEICRGHVVCVSSFLAGVAHWHAQLLRRQEGGWWNPSTPRQKRRYNTGWAFALLFNKITAGRHLVLPWTISIKYFFLHKLFDGKTLGTHLVFAVNTKKRRTNLMFVQMGGNLIVDKHGKLILVYRSKTGADRPDMSTLLAKLKVHHSQCECHSRY